VCINLTDYGLIHICPKFLDGAWPYTARKPRLKYRESRVFVLTTFLNA
jgi:hypothetical protein